MFEVIKQEINNPFKPELIDSTTIILKQKSPFIQMSYRYEGDFTKLSDEEAIEKVLNDFHKEHYKEKIQESNILKLEVAFAEQKENFENKLNVISNQNTLIQEALFELTEVMLSDEEEPTEDKTEIEGQEDELEVISQEEDGTDESNEQIDGVSDLQ